jgi:hypothetical protein
MEGMLDKYNEQWNLYKKTGKEEDRKKAVEIYENIQNKHYDKGLKKISYDKERFWIREISDNEFEVLNNTKKFNYGDIVKFDIV